MDKWLQESLSKEEYELTALLLEREQNRQAGAPTFSMEEIEQMAKDLLVNEFQISCDILT